MTALLATNKPLWRAAVLPIVHFSYLIDLKDNINRLSRSSSIVCRGTFWFGHGDRRSVALRWVIVPHREINHP